MKTKKVLITSTSFAKADSSPIDLLTENGWEISRNKGPYEDEQLAKLIEDVDAIIVGNDIVGEKSISAAKKLKTIIVHGTGIDNIDSEAATRVGIRVLNTHHTNAMAVAEFVFAALMSLTRHIQKGRESLRSGEWAGSSFVGMELDQKILGIVGFGHIGQKTAGIGLGFGMCVQYYDIMRNEKIETQQHIKYAELHELLKTSDIVVLHIPLLPETQNLISTSELSLMKETAILINVSRGGIVVEDALIDALSQKRLAGAVLDVFEEEPPKQNCPLLTMDNVLCTPHMAGYTIDALKKTSMESAQNLINATK